MSTTILARPATVDTYDVRDELLRLAVSDPKGFCSLLYEAGLDLQGAIYRHQPSPFARAAREAGFALAEAALRYGQVADEVAEAPAEVAPELVAAARGAA